jgi:hypothetical protein
MATDITKAQTQEFMNIPNLITVVFLNFKPFQGPRMKTRNGKSTKIVFLLLNLQRVKPLMRN